MKFSIPYFKEYYQLKNKYQDIAQVTGGFGLVSGIFIFWFGWSSLVRLLIGGNPGGGPRNFGAWESFLVLIGVPLSIWLGIIGVALIFVVLRRITLDEAVSLAVKFTYPRDWLKESGEADKPQPVDFRAGKN